MTRQSLVERSESRRGSEETFRKELGKTVIYIDIVTDVVTTKTKQN